MGIETAILASLGLGLGGAAGGIAGGLGGMMAGSPDDLGGYNPTEPPDYGSILQQIMNAQINALPKQFKAESTWGPMFNDLGYGEQARMTPKYNQLALDQQKLMAPQQIDFLTNLMKQYYPQIAGAQNAATQIQNTQNLANYNKWAPQYKSAIESLYPEQTTMRNQLGQDIQSQYNAGTGLDAGLRREIEQGIRAGQAGRGMTQGAAPIAAEAFAKGSAGQNLRNQREQKAFSYLNLPQLDLMGQVNNPQGQAGTQQMIAGSGQAGTPGFGMFQNRAPSLIKTSDALGALGIANNQWGQQNQYGAQNQQNAQNRAYMDWQNQLNNWSNIAGGLGGLGMMGGLWGANQSWGGMGQGNYGEPLIVGG